MDNLVETKNPLPKAYMFMGMLYLSLILAANLIIFKIVEVTPNYSISAGAFIIPVWFVVGDIIAEVYGYRASKNLIWITMAADFIFSAYLVLLIHLPSPDYFTHQAAFDFVLGGLMRIFLVLFIAVLLGGFLNAYLLTKWKFMVKGKYFWLRSWGSSWISQIIFSIVTVGINLYGQMPFNYFVRYILTSFPEKMIILAILVIPASWVVHFLKIYEGREYYDPQLVFNPFKLDK